MDPAKKLTISNKEQIRLLVDQMEQRPVVTRGQRTFGYWEQLSNELNSLGPPFRKRQDWQRVMINYKQNLRRKMKNNRQNVKETGEEQSQEVSLTTLENAAADILKTTAAVSPAGQTFGLESPSPMIVDNENSPPPSSLPPQRTPKVGKRLKINAFEEQTRNQVQIIKKLDAIKKCCRKNYEINKEILQIKKHKLLLFEKKEEDEAKIRKLDIQLKQE